MTLQNKTKKLIHSSTDRLTENQEILISKKEKATDPETDQKIKRKKTKRNTVEAIALPKVDRGERTRSPKNTKSAIRRQSRSRSQRRSRHRKDSRDRKQRRRDNSRSHQKNHTRKQRQEKVIPKEAPKMPEEVPFQDTTLTLLPGERRRRQRSRSPRDYYRRNNGGNDAQFWDSYSWVPKLNYISNASSSAIINTKKMRRLQLTNMPLEIGLRSEDINEIVTQFMIKNYLTDNMNTCPIMKIDISQADRSVSMELSSVEQTARFCKMQKIQLFKGSFCGVIRLGDSMYGSSLVSQAQTAAKAQAAAFAAINILQNKATKFDISGGMVSIQSSNVLRIINAVTPYMSEHLTQEQWNQYYEDLVQGFSEHGKIKHSWLVKKEQRMVCAEPGNLFIEYQKKQQAEKAMQEMQGRCFDERELKLYFVPEIIYQNHFKPNSTK